MITETIKKRMNKYRTDSKYKSMLKVFDLVVPFIPKTGVDWDILIEDGGEFKEFYVVHNKRKFRISYIEYKDKLCFTFNIFNKINIEICEMSAIEKFEKTGYLTYMFGTLGLSNNG